MFFEKLNFFFHKLKFFINKKFIQWKWKILGPYYRGLSVQTHFLYKQSELFKLRWQEMGLDFALKSFKNNPDEQMFFFRKAQKEPLIIRFNILMDVLTGKELGPYYIKKEE